MKEKIRISVIVPTYNRNEFLIECLRSLLAQTVLPGEIIVVDNYPNSSSTKGVVSVLQKSTSIPIHYLQEPKKGASYARNWGIRGASFPYLAFIDDDCTAHREWIETIVDYFKTKKSSVIQGRSLNGFPNNLFSCVEYFFSELLYRSNTYSRNKMLYSLALDTKNFAVEKSFILEKKLFFSPLSSFEDIDWGIRARKEGTAIGYIKSMLVYHYGKSTLIDYLLHEFNRGIGYYDFQKKWSEDFAQTQDIEKYLQRKKKWKKYQMLRDSRGNKVRKQLMQEIINKKSIAFIALFYVIATIDDLISKLGFLLMKVKHLT